MEKGEIISCILLCIFVGILLSSCISGTTVNFAPDEIVEAFEDLRSRIGSLEEHVDELSTEVNSSNYCRSLLKELRFVSDDNKIHHYECDRVIMREESGEKFAVYTIDSLKKHPEYTICEECSWLYSE